MSAYKLVFEEILAKLDAETRRRKARPIDVWILAERRCVLREINRQRTRLRYPPVHLPDVERTERLAVGHSDYVQKYAHAAADLVFREHGWRGFA